MSEQPTGIDLHKLPQLTPPRDVLAQVLAGSRTGRAATLSRWPVLAAAALALLAAGLTLTLRHAPATAPDQGAAGSGPVLAHGGAAGASALDYWINYSQQLEQQLRAVRPGSTVLNGHRAAAINLLQEEMAMIDLALARTRQPGRSLLLWQARTARLNDLVAVHAASASALSLNDERDPALDPVITLQPPLTAEPVSLQL